MLLSFLSSTDLNNKIHFQLINILNAIFSDMDDSIFFYCSFPPSYDCFSEKGE